MELCPVCGKTYGVTHSCTGPVATESTLAAKWPVPSGFAPVHYFRQALAIARLDDGAVLAASRDKSAMLYGAILWLVGQSLIFAGTLWAGVRPPGGFNWFALLFGVQILIVLDAILLLAQYGVCHLLARWWFGARGTYVGVLRPLLLGSIVTWPGVVPYVGMVIAALWSVGVMMIVFEDVEGIERLKAFGLSLVTGIILMALAHGLLAPR